MVSISKRKNRSASSEPTKSASIQSSLTSFFNSASKQSSAELTDNASSSQAVSQPSIMPSQNNPNAFFNPADVTMTGQTSSVMDPEPVKPAKRRGRPPKNASSTRPSSAQSTKSTKSTESTRSDKSTEATSSETKIPKKRGRKPKNAATSTSAPKPPKIKLEKEEEIEQEEETPANEHQESEEPLSTGRRRSGRTKSRKSYAGMSLEDEYEEDDGGEYQAANDAVSDISDDNQVEEPEGDEFEDEPATKTTKSRVMSTKTPKKSRFSQSKDLSKLSELSRKRKINGSLLTQIHVISGHSQESISRVVGTREQWQQYMFIPSKESIGKNVVIPDPKYGVPLVLQDDQNPLRYSQELTEMSEENAQKYIVQPAQDNIIINDSEIGKFESKNTEEAGQINGTLLNSGGVVTSIAWAHGMPDPKEQYLAVGILDDNNRDPMKSTTVDPNISVFSQNSYPSSVYIYKVDLSEKEEYDTSEPITQLVCTLSGDFGSCIKLDWRPVNGESDIIDGTLGHLAILNQDGGLRVFNIPHTKSSKPVHWYATKPLREFKMKKTSKISTFCWRTPEILSFATSEGQVGEFDIACSSSKYQNIPSFLIPAFDSVVICIGSGYPNNSNIVFASSTNGYSCIFDTRNPANRNYNFRKKGFSYSAAYTPHFESFLLADESHFTQASFIRFFKAHMHSNSLTKHKAVVTSIDVSSYHPFVLSGSADGTVVIGNMNRRLLARKRVKEPPYEQALLWSVDFNNKLGHYKVEPKYVPMVLEKPRLLPIQQMYPPNVTVKDIKWSVCQGSAEWYAAATTGGIIKIHRLAPLQ